MVPRERRQYARKVINLPLTIVVDGTALPANIVDISRGGLRIHARAPIALSNRVVVRTRLLPQRDCEGEGEVVRIGIHGDFGVEFDTTSAELGEFLDDLVNVRDELESRLLRSVVDPTIFVETS